MSANMYARKKGRRNNGFLRSQIHEASRATCASSPQKARRRAPASVRLPVRQEHLRANHRRCARRDASASTLEDKAQKGGDVAAAARIGKMVAERATKAGVTEVVFDRGAYLYHGRVKALADAAREAGLKF